MADRSKRIELQSFNIDSNIKGRYENNEFYRGLSCICLNPLDEIVASNNGNMTVELLKQSDNFVFGESLVNNPWNGSLNNIDRLLKASPSMKIITLLNDGNIEIIEKES